MHAIYLAKQGYKVTGLDFIPKALEMAAARATAETIDVNWVRADVLDWHTADSFDLILDSGCLHGIGSGKLPRYKQQLLSWLVPGGDYVLAHFGRRHFLDWRPVGPRRRKRTTLVRLFSPELREQAYSHEIERTPLPIGPTVLTQSFWFHRVG
jgi:SAM-dependent methyltransferase